MDFEALVQNVIGSYREIGGVNRNGAENLPNRANVVAALSDLQALIFPGYKYEEQINEENLRYMTARHINRVISILTVEIQKALLLVVGEALTYGERDSFNEKNFKNTACFNLAEKTVESLVAHLPDLRKTIQKDLQAITSASVCPERAASEVILAHPGLEAVLVYRIAHFLHSNGVPLIPRIMTEHTHGKTGIDIHPGAEIGEGLVIAHGTGVVIGESAVIGKNVKIYQGVTLGSLHDSDRQNKKRHPTIEDDVTIYSNATILGGQTVIGKGATIAGNTFITQSVPAGVYYTGG